jgi:replication-associated recombination protein RarA
LQNRQYYLPTSQGWEEKIRARLEELRRVKEKQKK